LHHFVSLINWKFLIKCSCIGLGTNGWAFRNERPDCPTR